MKYPSQELFKLHLKYVVFKVWARRASLNILDLISFASLSLSLQNETFFFAWKGFEIVYQENFHSITTSINKLWSSKMQSWSFKSCEIYWSHTAISCCVNFITDASCLHFTGIVCYLRNFIWKSLDLCELKIQISLRSAYVRESWLPFLLRSFYHIA